MNGMGGNTTVDSHWQMKMLNILCQIKELFMSCCGACPTTFLSHCLPDSLTVSGTIVCPVVNGKSVRLCLQEGSQSSPLILLDLPLNTSAFSSLIKHGMIRMVFECKCDSAGSKEPLLSNPQWVMYCNGLKMGLARRRELSWKDEWLLEMTRTVSAGAGFLPDKGSGGHKYLRGQFEKVPGSGSDHSQAYHLIDPSDSFGQELSIFFLGH